LQEKINRVSLSEYKQYPIQAKTSAPNFKFNLNIKFKNGIEKHLSYNNLNESVSEDVLVLLTYIKNLQYIFIKKIDR
jgi:hypothetical protein